MLRVPWNSAGKGSGGITSQKFHHRYDREHLKMPKWRRNMLHFGGEKKKERKVRLWAEDRRLCPSYLLTSSTAFVLAIKAEQCNVFLLWCGCTYTGLTAQFKKKIELLSGSILYQLIYHLWRLILKKTSD